MRERVTTSAALISACKKWLCESECVCVCVSERERERERLTYLEPEHIKNGSKGLLLNNGGIMGQSGNQSWLYIVTRSVDSLQQRKM